MGQALEPLLILELGEPVEIIDLSAQQKRWDFEALSRGSGSVLRRISHTRTECPATRAAMSEMWKDIAPATEQRLEELGVRDRAVSLHAHELPSNRERRRELGRILAERIAGLPQRSLELSDLTGDDPSVVEDPLFRAFNDVTVLPCPVGRSIVAAGSDERLWRWKPPLWEIILPCLQEKIRKHGAEAASMTLVIHLVEYETLNPETIAEVRAILKERHRVFCSLYVVQERHPSREFDARRVY